MLGDPKGEWSFPGTERKDEGTCQESVSELGLYNPKGIALITSLWEQPGPTSVRSSVGLAKPICSPAAMEDSPICMN